MRKFWYGISFGLIIGLGVFLLNQEEQSREDSISKLTIPKAEDSTYTRGYDFNKNGANYHHYSDEEIRMMREKLHYETEGEYYIKTPGRHVPSYEEEFEQRMEQYIEDNYKD